MLTREQQIDVSKELEEIKNKILQTLECKKNQCWIKTKKVSFDGGFWSKSSSIYGGLAGVLLFLLEYQKIKPSSSISGFLDKGCNWLESQLETQDSISSFYTGNLGVVYVLIKIGLFYGDTRRIAIGISFIKSVRRYDKETSDLLNGTAGVVLGLLKIHELTKEDSLLDDINHYLEKIIRQAFLDNEGPSWDRSIYQRQSLCGLSHGAAGMAFLFAEVGYYFNKESYFWLADQMVAYENSHYSSDKINWPDFRIAWRYNRKVQKLAEREYKRGSDYTSVPGDLSAWCHGAVGIGLQRLRLFTLTKNSSYLKDIEFSYRKVTISQENPTSVSICHGILGDILLMKTLSEHLSNDKYPALLQSLVNKALAFRYKHNRYKDGVSAFDDGRDDNSLFNGITGVAYVFLSLLNPKQDLDIHLPILKSKYEAQSNNHHYLNISKSNIISRILFNYYPNISHSVDNDEYNELCSKYFKIQGQRSQLPSKKDLLNNMAASKHHLELSVSDWSQFGIFIYSEGKNVDKLLSNSIHKLLDTKLEFSRYCRLYTQTQQEADQASYYLLYIDSNSLRCESEELTVLKYEILKAFSAGNSPSNAFQGILSTFELEGDLIEELELFFQTYIKFCIKKLILTEILIE